MGTSSSNPKATKQPAQPRFGRIDLGLEAIRDGIGRARDWLLGQQHEDGYWCGELEADSMLESDYIFMHTLLGTGDPGKMERAVNEILRHQNEDGGWSLYPGGPSNISYGVKAYLALKLMGWSKDHPVMVKAREWVLANGGVVECNTFTKIYLCALGQYDYDAVPAIPPEIVLFPNWCYFNLYEISSWSRGILVPLSIIYAKKPFKKLAPEQGIDELFVGGRQNSNLHLRWDKKRPISWRNFFLFTDRMIHWFERVHIRPLRKMAINRAKEWMLERFEKSDGLGAIYPAMLNSIVALRCLDYSLDDPQMIRAMDEFEKLGIDCPEGTPDYPVPTFRMQPCFPPVWDTAQAMYALGDAGVRRDDPRMLKAADWILSKEVRQKGDWAEKVKNVEPGGWYFEFNNEFYPDVDDTGQVLLALNCVDNPRERYQYEVCQRALNWIWAMQCKNGGWAAFDKDNTKSIFQYIPFADHNAMLDPPTVDITGRMLEMLGAVWLHPQRPSRREGHSVHPQRAGVGRKLVRPLGRQLSLRHVPRAARPRSHGFLEPRARRAAGRRVDSHGAELRRRLGRDLRHLRRSQPARHRAEHAFADRLGGPRTARRRRHALRLGCEGRSLADRAAARGWKLGRAGARTQRRKLLHRNGLPARLLSWVPPVQAVLPAAGADDV